MLAGTHWYCVVPDKHSVLCIGKQQGFQTRGLRARCGSQIVVIRSVTPSETGSNSIFNTFINIRCYFCVRKIFLDKRALDIFAHNIFAIKRSF